jgi:hypothetical protein
VEEGKGKSVENSVDVVPPRTLRRNRCSSRSKRRGSDSCVYATDSVDVVVLYRVESLYGIPPSATTVDQRQRAHSRRSNPVEMLTFDVLILDQAILRACVVRCALSSGSRYIKTTKRTLSSEARLLDTAERNSCLTDGASVRSHLGS